MFDIDNTQAQSVTATVCENAQLYGATPERDEFDPREVWDADDTMDAVSEAFRIIAEGVGPDGTQLADERESLLWGFVNTFDAQVRRLDRSVDRLSPELRDLQREQDGTEIKSRELELVTDRAQNFGDRRDAFEKMRDLVADAYRRETGNTWRPRRGSNVSQTGKLTSAAIDARDFMRARKDRQMKAHLPEGTLVAIAGGIAGGKKAKYVILDGPAPSSTASTRLNLLPKGEGPPAKYDDRTARLILACGTAADPASSASPRSGPNATGCTRWCASPTGTRHTDGPLRCRRNERTAEPPAEGRHRVPRLRHHREPRRQSPPARNTGPTGRRVERTATTGRVASAAWPVSFWSDPSTTPPNGPPSLRASPAAPRSTRRRAPRGRHVRRSMFLPPSDDELAHTPLYRVSDSNHASVRQMGFAPGPAPLDADPRPLRGNVPRFAAGRP